MRERRSLLLGAVIMLACLVFASLVPRLFYNPAPVQTTPNRELIENISFGALTRSERIKLFNQRSERAIKLDSEPEIENIEQLKAKLSEIVTYAMQNIKIDRQYAGISELLSSGENLFYIPDGKGGGIRYIEVYEEVHGDWSNWTNMFVDIDSLEIYYLYHSAGIKNAFSQYKELDKYDAYALAREVTGLGTDMTRSKVARHTDDSVPIHEITMTNGLVYEAELRYHPVSLFDYKLILT
ncbi:hypothetical protein LJC01_02950, partial [Clostridiaceae bacterium OttesenSCG-928-D20]|nr:hypothetical protein [Clostridiaceae bacterium OttesenSCG-928-D20]